MLTRDFLWNTLSPSATPLWPETAWAKEDIVRQDTSEDGKIDQAAHIDERGKITKLEIDNNADGLMDCFQYYDSDEVIRVERDTNHDKLIDSWDYFEMTRLRIESHKKYPDTARIRRIEGRLTVRFIIGKDSSYSL